MLLQSPIPVGEWRNAMSLTIVCDIDGCITNEIVGYTYDSYNKRTRNNFTIEALKDYKRRGYRIVLYTARHKEDEKITTKWLAENDVPYDELVLGKPLGNVYVDDMAVSHINKEVLCVSGGMDSTIAWFYLNQPKAIYVKLGHKYETKEIESIHNLERVIPGFKVDIIDTELNLRQFEVGTKAYISKRNLLLAIIAGYYGNKIYIVGVKGDSVEDKSPEAFKVMSNCLNFIQKPNEPPVKIDSPFWGITKPYAIKYLVDSQGKEFAQKVLRASVSCYDETTMGQCGECPSCFRKWTALEYCKIDCIDWFETDPRGWAGIDEYQTKIENGAYDFQRSQEIKYVLEKYRLWK